ncbi:MAG TPA: EscU/YscU/HrcU family type III secretion system export apparatus switch protein [Steroidobacteraceae bacterium]|nr:EscU/YscU/HrcU family type III secretion system export apparatus switch protein [Steroidobacteraceae bacterium]
MAEDKSNQAKTEKPTAHRLRHLRRKGQVPVSKDVAATAATIAGCTFLALAGNYWIARCSALIRAALEFDFVRLQDNAMLIAWIEHGFATLMVLCIPPIVLIGCAATLALALQTGGVFSTDLFKPQLNRLSPAAGIKRLFSMQTAIELLKLIVKTFLLFSLLWIVLRAWLPDLLRIHHAQVEAIQPIAARVLAIIAWGATALFIATTVFDLWFQRWNFQRRNRMSVEELKRERKETEGDPLLRSRRKHMHQEIALADMLANTRRASVVVVNPTHIAVALHYAPGETDLPVVVAKGEGFVARAIRRVAQEEGIPVMHNIELARALHGQAPLNQYIPDDFIEPVAAVLRWARELRR